MYEVNYMSPKNILKKTKIKITPLIQRIWQWNIKAELDELQKFSKEIYTPFIQEVWWWNIRTELDEFPKFYK